jgi:hypothetical protein
LPPQAPAHLGNGSDGRTWSSPFRDAVDVITEKLLDRRTIEPVEGFSEEDLIRQKCMQNDIMQNHADYTGRPVCNDAVFPNDLMCICACTVVRSTVCCLLG